MFLQTTNQTLRVTDFKLGYLRFTRQYRCEPPPEFPLASSYLGIVHHLSGPDRYARIRILLRRSRSVDSVSVRNSASARDTFIR
ncbi:hypothetical protein V6N13_086071 [Hibiscus sabdariffa]